MRARSLSELAAAGVKRISLATSLYRAAMTVLLEAVREVKNAGTFAFRAGGGGGKADQPCNVALSRGDDRPVGSRPRSEECGHVRFPRWRGEHRGAEPADGKLKLRAARTIAGRRDRRWAAVRGPLWRVVREVRSAAALTRRPRPGSPARSDAACRRR